MKKGAKRTFVLGTAFAATLSLSNCGKVYGPPPGGYKADFTPTPTKSIEEEKKTGEIVTTGLEHKITERVSISDFEGQDEILGWYDGTEFLGKGYKAVSSEDEAITMKNRPEVFVSYIITPYPDYSSSELAVTGIIIKDPAVTVYGNNIETALETFDNTLKENGFWIEPLGDGFRHAAHRDDITISYGNGMIQINAEVTNEQGLVF
ncbi:MAG: hypothetical protein J5643_02690 [Lachnospiraceae bacterium]|nr:hypothetical protein [Lachnospiraceae bacterium]MBR5677986.1 hypothetical protein [Paludibacteraceae bacterium]